MVITEVKVFPVNEDRLKAYVSITIDDCFVVRPSRKLDELFGASSIAGVQDNRWVMNEAAFGAISSFAGIIGVKQ